jgi:hypothetical protein
VRERPPKNRDKGEKATFAHLRVATLFDAIPWFLIPSPLEDDVGLQYAQMEE